MTQILVVKPKTLNATDKKALRDAGVVCVEATNPSEVVLLQPESQPVSGSDMFWAAMKAIASDKYSGNTQEVFAKNMARLVKVSESLDSDKK